MRANCFAPVVGDTPRLLILGSVPSVRSLAAQQYYAHPRNAFWPIMSELLGFDPALPYEDRLQILRDNGVALWDVVESCVRPGSLDASIDDETVATNDIPDFFAQYPTITRVFFNGAKSEQIFRRQVLPGLHQDTLHLQRLPSTSPANAGMSLAQKRQAWKVVLA